MNAFDDIYRQNVWHGKESLSGPGSGTASTTYISQRITDLVVRFRIHSVIDIGCGDGFWMPDLPGYIGIDVSETAVALSQKRHPDRLYLHGEFVDMDLRADLIIIRDVIQHLPLHTAVTLVKGAYERCQWLFASTYDSGKNEGITPQQLAAGWAYDNDLTASPFDLPQPVMKLPDGAGWDDPQQVRDPHKFLGVWSTRLR